MHRCAVAAVLAGALLGSAACGSTDTKAGQARALASSAGLDPAVGDLLALATAAPDATFVVTYPITATDGTNQQVTVTQRPPDRRVDVYRPDGTIESTIRTGGRSYQCSKGASWTCASLGDQPPLASNGVLDPTAAAAAVQQLTQRAADYDFRVEDRPMLGVTARCLVTTRKPGHDDPSLGANATLCLAPTGAQLLVEVPRGTLQATDYRADVPEGAFTLPAPAGPAAVTTTTAAATSSSGG